MSRSGHDSVLDRRRVVVVTGASAGVGRATSRAFAREGAAIGLIARGEERLHEAAREVEELGGRALVLPLDVANAAAVDAAAETIEHTLGAIDVWVNNAMASVFAPVDQVTPDEFRRVTEVTYLGTVHGTLAALRRMQPRDHGVIVQVGSALAYQSIPLQAAYCAAKHAVKGFTESLRMELRHNGCAVRVTIVQLPAVNTPQFGWARSKLGRRPQPVPPIFQPEVAARAILWSAAHAPRELVVGSSSQLAILGQRLAPGFMERYLSTNAWDAQQTGVPDLAGRDNLWRPGAGTAGAHGDFNDRARASSPHLWLATHPAVARLGALAGALAVGTLAARAFVDPRRGGRAR
jgi:NAD(P)-dependent dehydrogenase (short-subunit alcohol dehydrogenase family)